MEQRFCSYCGQKMIADEISADEFNYPIRYDKNTGSKLFYPRYVCPSYVEYARSHRWRLFSFNPHDNYILTDSPIN
jgi:hypothetical protein